MMVSYAKRKTLRWEVPVNIEADKFIDWEAIGSDSCLSMHVALKLTS